MQPWLTPARLSQDLCERLGVGAAFPNDTTLDTPVQRDMRDLLAFAADVLIVAKRRQVAGVPDAELMALIDPAALNFELP